MLISAAGYCRVEHWAADRSHPVLAVRPFEYDYHYSASVKDASQDIILDSGAARALCAIGEPLSLLREDLTLNINIAPLTEIRRVVVF